MRKTSIAFLLTVFLITSSALGEIMEGTTIAASTYPAKIDSEGVLNDFSIEPGQQVEEGEYLGSTAVQKVFASRDGIISRCEAKDGDSVTDTVLEVSPVNLYTIYCTASEAYSSPENMLIRSGDTVYIRCTSDGSHRGIGIVTRIDGIEYQVETIGGELYIGEVVRIFNNDSFETSSRIGIGTVISTPVDTYSANGTILHMDVESGESIQRGELLFTYVSDESAEITAPVSGIVAEVPVKKGDKVCSGQIAANIAAYEDICIEIRLDEESAGKLHRGTEVSFTCANDSEENIYTGTIIHISSISEDQEYTAWIRPDEPLKYIGLNVEVNVPL